LAAVRKSRIVVRVDDSVNNLKDSVKWKQNKKRIGFTMRHNTSNRRSRGRNNRGNKGQGNNRAKVFDSNGPEVRIRGTAFQICEKYEALAKDARSSGDIVLAESYMQHAEHYQRMIVEWNEQAEAQNQDKQHNNQSNQKTYNKQKENTGNDDLSLPNSILGDEVKVKSQVSEKVLENA